MDTKDLRVDTYNKGVPPISMSITHIPTNKMVKGTGDSLFKLKKRLFNELLLLVGGEPCH